MKQVVAKNLGEKDRHPVFREASDVGSSGHQGLRVAYGYCRDALHGKDVRSTIVPIDFRHIEHVGALEISFELSRVGRFAHQVELLQQRLFEFADDLPGSQPRPVGPVTLGELGECIEHGQISLDRLANSRPQDFHDDALAAAKRRPVDLCHGGGRQRLSLETRKELIGRLTERGREDLKRLFRRERRYSVLEFGELVGNVRRE